MKPLAIVTGVGPGTGASLVRRFHEGGYQVAMLARNAERLDALGGELPDAFAVPCDVSDTAALQSSLNGIEARVGAAKVVVHNALGGAFANFLDVDPSVLERNFQVNVMALMYLGRWRRRAWKRPAVVRSCHRQHLGGARLGQLRRARPDQGGAAHPR